MWTFWNFNDDMHTEPSVAAGFGASGAGLILSALAIFIMPEIVAYLVATIMLWGGAMMVWLAFRARKMNRRRWHSGAVWEIW